MKPSLLYALLKGATIEQINTVNIYGVTMPCMAVTTKDGLKLNVYVQRDEEGNDGGHLEAEER